jgi:hypothetical protein
VIVAVHMNGNAPVGVIGPVDDRCLTLTKRIIDPVVNGVDHHNGGVLVQVHGHDHGGDHVDDHDHDHVNVD